MKDKSISPRKDVNFEEKVDLVTSSEMPSKFSIFTDSQDSEESSNNLKFLGLKSVKSPKSESKSLKSGTKSLQRSIRSDEKPRIEISRPIQLPITNRKDSKII